MLYNVYCDETCHLEHDGINVMVLGAVWCQQDKLKEINQRIRQIKERRYVLKFQGKIGDKPKYGGRILAVGISYDKETKKHSCKVEVL